MNRYLFALMVLSTCNALSRVAQAQERQEKLDANHAHITTVEDKPGAPPDSRKPVLLPDDGPDALTRISQALDKRVRFDFRGVTLKDVISRFKTALDIDISIDQKAFREDGIPDDYPVQEKASGVKFRSALTMILEPMMLTWMIENETLVVTTQTRAVILRDTKIYDVTDLVVGPELDPADDPRQIGRQGMLLGAIVSNTGGPNIGEWADDGGEGQIKLVRVGNLTLIVVNQTRGVLHEIEYFLANLREIVKTAQ